MNSLKEFFTNIFKKKEVIEVTPRDLNNLKEIIKNSLALFYQFKDSNADGKITTIEWGGIAKKSLPLLNNVRKYKVIKATVLSIDSEQGLELVAYCMKLGIVPDQIEVVIRNTVEAVEKSVEIYKTNIIPIYQALKTMKVKK